MTPLSRPSRRVVEGGFTYLALLLAVALLGLALAAASEVWSAVARRERLAQTDWAGEQIAQAIGSYYEQSPGGLKTFPQSLEALLEDRRGPIVRRHLRSVHRNPLDGEGAWIFVRGPDLRIRGVASRSPIDDASPSERRYIYNPAHPLRWAPSRKPITSE